MRSSPPGGISAHPSPPPRDPRIEEKCGAIPRLQPDQGPGRGANADRVGFRGRKKTFLRGGGVGGMGEGRGTRASHSWLLSPPRVVACHASHVTQPACLSALLSASLFLNCIITIIARRTEIIIYVRIVSQLQLPFFLPSFLPCALFLLKWSE